MKNLVRNNKEKVLKNVTEKIRTEAIEELLCLPPNEEPPQDLASIISDSFSYVFYKETNIITSGFYEEKNSIFLLVNDMNSGLTYFYDVDPNGLVHFNFDHSCMFDINSIQLDSLNMGTNEPKNISIWHDLTLEDKENFERILTKKR